MNKTKKQRLITFVLALCMVCSLFSGLRLPVMAAELDLAADEIVVDSVEDFLTICDAANFDAIKAKTIKLEADIDMNGQAAIAPIGGTVAFEGVFDGQYHTIKNLTIAGSSNATGLFGVVGTSGKIMNLGLDRVKVSGSHNTGAFAGCLTGSVTSCYAVGEVEGARYTGGIAGMLHSGTIENCWVDIALTGTAYCGSLFGGTTWNTRADDGNGNSSIDYTPLSGKIPDRRMVIRNNLVLGTATGNRFVAGITGDMANPVSGQATHLEAFEGNVSWIDSVTVRHNNSQERYGQVYANWKNRVDATLTVDTRLNLYWDGITFTAPDPSITQTESQNHEQVKVVAKTDTELSAQATYESIGWDFANTWTWSDELGHPVLQGFSVPDVFVPGEQKHPASIVTTFVGSPKTTRAFTWYTDTSITQTVVQAVPSDLYTGESDFTGANAVTATGANYKLQTSADGDARHIHKVQLEGLTAGTTYKYRVGDGEYWSQVLTFTTEQEDAASFTFFNITDTQDQDADSSSYDRYANTLKYATEAYPEAEFILHTGDVIQWNSTADYDAVYSVTSKYTTNLPSMVTPGNHELDKDTYLKPTDSFPIDYVKGLDNFKAHYQFPDNGPENGKQIIYSFDYGNAHFVVLDSNNKYVSEADQIAWLKEDLANTDKVWKIVSLHHGPINASSSIASQEMLKALSEMEVDLVLFGHYHAYARSNPLQVDANGTITVGTSTQTDGVWYATTEGTVYHSAGASATAAISSSGKYFAVKTNTTNDSLYTAITITEDSLLLKTHSVPNNTSATESVLLDAFAFVKPAASAVTVVAADEQTYNGSAQTLIKSAETSAQGVVVYSLDGITYSAELPTATDAGTYQIWYKVDGDADHSDSEVKTVEAVIVPKDITNAQVTLGEALTYTGAEQTQSIESVVIDGLTVTYTVAGNTGTEISDTYTLTVTGTGNFTGTVTKPWSIAKANATYTAPTANTLVYNEKAQELITAGSTNDGTMLYSLDGVTYSETIPTATNAATYTVWYKVQGDAIHNDVAAQSIEVTIAPKDISSATVTLGDALTYNGQEQTQSVASVELDDMTVTYEVSGNKATEAETEYVLTVTGTGNFTGTVNVKWSIKAPETYTVTFDSDGGNAVTAQTVESGKTATKPADPAKEGYTFKGWFLGNDAYDFSKPVTGAITLKAKWEVVVVVPTTYTVTFDSNGGNAVTAQTVESGKTAAKPADPVKEGYTFKGWFLGEEEYDFTKPVTGIVTLKAKWEKVSNPDVPNTGDSANLVLWGSLAAISTTTLVVLLVCKKKRVF